LNSKLLLVLLVLTILRAPAMAISYYPQSQALDLKLPSNATCNLTVTSPNGTLLVDEQATTSANAVLQNYTLDTNQTATLGTYTAYFCASTLAFGISLNGITPPDANLIVFFIIAFIAIIAAILYTLIRVLMRFKTVDIDPMDIVYCFITYFALFIIYGMNLTYVGNVMINSLLEVFIVAFGFTHIILPMILFVIAYFKQLGEINLGGSA